MKVTTDVAAERAVIAGICQHGTDLFLDVTDFVKTSSFSINSNQVIFKCVEHVCKQHNVETVDLPSIFSAAKELNLDHILERKEEAQHLNSVLQYQANRDTVRRFAAKLRRLEIARKISEQGGLLQEKMSEVDGTETIAQLLGVAESTIFDFTGMFEGESELKPVPVGEGILEYVKYLGENPTDTIGISTGYKDYDASIGGGLNPGVAMIGARPKHGKTTLCINIANNIARTDIPVLYLDTEMVEKGRYRDISDKMLASCSDTDILDVKTGRFAQKEKTKSNVEQAAKEIEGLPLYRLDIAGKAFEDQLYAMRRWVQSEVGLNPDGTAKECVIIYDYLKLMEGATDAMREFQKLGMMMTALQNFATRYAIPMLVFTQLNRDGIDGEGSNVAAGSDRLTWFCTSFSIFKYKSAEEIAEDGPEMGNRKLVTIMSRYGPGHDFGEYCNFWMNKWRAQIKEIDPDKVNEFGDEFIVQAQNDAEPDGIQF